MAISSPAWPTFISISHLRAFELLKPNGMIVFISSNKWFGANYGKMLRAYLGSNSFIKSITDFGDLPVFGGATAYPMIFVAKKCETQRSTRYTEVPSLDQPYPDVQGVARKYGRELPDGALTGERWSFADAERAAQIEFMKSRGTTLGEYVHGETSTGSRPATTKPSSLTAKFDKSLYRMILGLPK